MTPANRYLKVPVIALLVLAPLMGAVYAMFLPFIGFAMLFTFLGKKAFAMGRVRRGGRGGDDDAGLAAGRGVPGERQEEADARTRRTATRWTRTRSTRRSRARQRREPRRPDLHD